MARTQNKKKKVTKLSDLPLESAEEKYNRYFQSTEDETKKLINRYFKMLSSVENNDQAIKKQIGKTPEVGTSNKKIDKDMLKCKKVGTSSKSLKKSKRIDVQKVNNRDSSKKTARKKITNDKLECLIKKLKPTIYSEEIKNVIKEYVLAEPRAKNELSDIITNTNDKFIKIILKSIIHEINEEAANDSKPEAGIRKLSLKTIPNKELKSPETPTTRKSLRLSSHPPGYFQTKPAMIIYVEPGDISNKQENTARTKSDEHNGTKQSALSHTLPKAKRRRLYNPNSI